MKILFSLLLLCNNLFTNVLSIPFDEVEQAFVKKNAELLMKNAHEKVSISTNGKENMYSNQQATMFFSDLFKKNQPNSFKFIFKGKENPEGSFGIAQYNGKLQKLRLTFHFKKIENHNKIFRIIIEEE